MPVYKVNGPTILRGAVNLQGAKNSALKHIISPLLANDKFVLDNIPDITSVVSILEIVKLQGADVKQLTRNKISVDTSKLDGSQVISSDLFYHTSGGILFIPILASRFGKCEIILDDLRKDTGGDQIGRTMSWQESKLEEIGISKTIRKNRAIYSLASKNPFEYEIPGRAFSISVGAVYTALFRKGTSRIYNYCLAAEFDDIVLMLKSMGARITVKKDVILVRGNNRLDGVKYTNMHDKQDFVTFLSAALCTQSKIIIRNVEYEKMKLDCLDGFLKEAGIKLHYDKSAMTCEVIGDKIKDLKPVDLVAAEYPDFVTEWQVLLSPLLALIKGESTVVEGIFPDRMRHWKELSKFGARYEYYKVSGYPEIRQNPRAVKIQGPVSFKGANVQGKDVRAAAAMIISALAADGKSKIIDPDGNIDRGYEDLAHRLKKLGADIEIG